MSEIAKLIERLKRATGPDRQLDNAMADALGFKVPDSDAEGWPLHYTRDIDAALTAVPNNYWLSIEFAGVVPSDLPRRWPVVKFGRGGTEQTAQAITAPLALCVAALRARERLFTKTKVSP